MSLPGTNWCLVAPQNKSQRPAPEKKRGDLGEDNVGGPDAWVHVFGGQRRCPCPGCLRSPPPASCVLLPGLPKMEASQPYSGIPPPPGAMGPALRLSPGDVVEVTVAEAEQLWWQVGTGPSRSCWDRRRQTTMAMLE